MGRQKMSPNAIVRTSTNTFHNSLNEGKTSNDIESGLVSVPAPGPTADDDRASSEPISSPSGLANDTFLRAFNSIQEKNYVSMEKMTRTVYRHLMDHLDAAEETKYCFKFTLTTSLELVVFSILLIILICTLTMDQINHNRFLRLRMWQYASMAMVIASGLFVIRVLTFLLTWPVLRWWRLHKYAVYFIRQLKYCVDFNIWFCVVLVSWYAWFRPRLRDVHGDISIVVAHHITRFLSTLWIGSFLCLLKNILYMKIEADLYYDHLFERIRVSVIYLHGLQIMYNLGNWRFLPNIKTKNELRKIVNGQLITSREDKVWRQGENVCMFVMAMKKGSVPIWILRRLAEEYIDQVKLRPLPGNSDIITKDDQEILTEAKKMFRQLISNRIENEKPDHYSDLEIKFEDLMDSYQLTQQDLNCIFDPSNKPKEEEQEDEVEESSSRATLREERTISYYEFLNWAVLAFKTCWAFERTLDSSKRVFIKLNRLMWLFLAIVVVIIWLLLSGIVNTGQLALLFAPFLAASFIFGDSCKKMFEGLIFAFAMHPFDGGDRVIINNVEMRVTELNILTSCFHKYDSTEKVIIPNSTLTTSNITNLDISPNLSDKVEFVVSAQTPLEDVKDLEIKIKKYLDDDIDYSSNNKVVKSEIGKEDIKMTVNFKYLVSYLTAESKDMHKSKILSKIMEFRNEMDQRKCKQFTSSFDLYSVDVLLAAKKKLNVIEDIKDEILRGLEEPYSSSSKVVITDLTRSNVKIGLYLYYSDDINKVDGEKRSGKEVDRRKKSANMWKVKKNLEYICKRLRHEKLVKEVRVYQMVKNAKVEVIAKGGIGCDS